MDRRFPGKQTGTGTFVRHAEQQQTPEARSPSRLCPFGAPLCVFINNLAKALIERFGENAYGVLCALFADDVSILTRDHRAEAARRAQEVVDLIVEWSRNWKLTLNASKSEVAFFSTWTKESNHQPIITIDGTRIPFNPNPTLLGVTFDRQLTFAKHLEDVMKQAASKTKMIAAVSHSKWGWDKQHLTQLFYAYIRSKLDFAGPGWQPWLSDTNLKVLDSTQNHALRAITGQLRSTPYEALRYETQISGYATHMKRNCLKSMEKAKRLPAGHPRRLALENAVPVKNPDSRRSSWFRLGSELSAKHIPEEAENRLPITLYSRAPWSPASSLTVNYTLEGVNSRHDDPEVIRACADKVIDDWTGDIVIYTDGSAAEGCRQGGSAAVVQMRTEPARTETIRRKGAALTSSCDEEADALDAAAQWITENCDSRSRVLILTDSQSLCRALASANHDVDQLRAALEASPASIHLQFIPGHCGIPGNEEADQAANEARLMEGASRAIALRGILPHINRSVKDPPCRERV